MCEGSPRGGALQLLLEMVGQGLCAHGVRYSVAISRCQDGSQWERALQLLWEMVGQGLTPNVISYNAAISACEKGQQWDGRWFGKGWHPI